MPRSIVSTAAATILLSAAIAPVAPAAAADGSHAPRDNASAQVRAADSDQIVLRRDGDRAVPFAIVAPAAPSDYDFHERDALIGAAGACALTVLAAWAFALIRRRRPPGRVARRPGASATA